jgi:phosphohistidine phosphatase SixA
VSRARRRWLAAATLALALLAPAAGRADEGLWALLRQGGQVVMIRHATAPGGGDPPGFTVDDCATQRNLGDEGREEARGIGEAFRTRGVPVGRVLSSQWCRCLETARLAFGRVAPWPALNSYFYEPSWDARFTPEVRELAGRRPEGGNLVLVTHQLNIRAIAGVSPASGEMVILTPRGDGTFTVAGRLPVSALRP